jgi:hypothetical protein
MSKKNDLKQEENTQEANIARREALKKLGKYAYTAPVVLGLLGKSNSAKAVGDPPPVPGSP